MLDQNRTQAAAWREARLKDISAINRIEAEVHSLLPERPEVFEEKIRLFGQGCMVLSDGHGIVGYGISYPWRLNDIPALDTYFGALPAKPQCIFIHDVALLPQARAHGAGRAFVAMAAGLAQALGLARLALVSVYDTHHLWARCGFAVAKPPSAGKLQPYGSTARYMTADLQASPASDETDRAP